MNKADVRDHLLGILEPLRLLFSSDEFRRFGRDHIHVGGDRVRDLYRLVDELAEIELYQRRHERFFVRVCAVCEDNGAFYLLHEGGEKELLRRAVIGEPPVEKGLPRNHHDPDPRTSADREGFERLRRGKGRDDLVRLFQMVLSCYLIMLRDHPLCA